MNSAEVHDTLGLDASDPPHLVVEKLFCAAVLAEGTDVAERVFRRFNEMRGALGSGIAQQRKGAICRTCHGSGVIGHMNPGDGMSDTSSECSKCGGTGRRAPVA
jgi:hypothetical protein